MSINAMTIDDYDAVVVLWEQSEGVGLTDADARKGIDAYLQRNPGTSFVAYDGEQLIGAVLCGDDGRRGYLHHLAVAKSHRRQGVGSQLVERCLAALRSIGIQKCNIMVYAENRDGATFWEQGGWIERSDLRIRQHTMLDTV